MGKKSRQIAWGILCLLGLSLAVLVGVYAYLQSELPRIRTLEDYRPPQATKIYSDDGYLVANLAHERRTVVDVASLPRHVVHAFLAAEDANFYRHKGLDYPGILRAVLKNLRPGAHLQGASTITQQTVKALVLGPERSYTRKIREAILARELEQLLTKDEILHIYLNQIYFGSGAWGVEEAAQTYFGKPVQKLTLGEAALMASIPKNPSRYTLRADPAAAKQRQRYVLDQMRLHAWATPEEVAEALKVFPATATIDPPYLNKAPHYTEHVRRLLIDKYGEYAVYTEGFKVYTGMHAPSQSAAHTAVRHGLEDLTRRQGYPGPILTVPADHLTNVRSRLHAAYDEAVQKRLALLGSANKRAPWMWDLGELSKTLIENTDEGSFPVRLMPLEDFGRSTGLVVKINKAEDEAWIDLGCCLAKISIKTLQWARRYSPRGYTPPPHHIADVLRPGDIVSVEIIRAGNGPHSQEKPTVRVELVPQPTAEGALAAIDPQTRLVRALVGGYSLEPGNFDRATQAFRQPGSAFKPILYAAALQLNAITPAAQCNDGPIAITDPWTGKVWRPENFEEGAYDGPITYRYALTRSKNTCSVRLIEKISPQAVVEVAHAMGISAPLPNNLTLALGTGDLTPLELANAFATIAALGIHSEPIFIRKIEDRSGHLLEEAQSHPKEVIKPAVAYVLTNMMQSVVSAGTGVRAQVLERPLAGKTGTSNESRNTWFAGFSPELVATAWVGFDNYEPLGHETGASAALPIWIRFMGAALAHQPPHDFPIPEGVVTVKINAKTGEPTSNPEGMNEVFVQGTEPSLATSPLPSIFLEDN